MSNRPVSIHVPIKCAAIKISRNKFVGVVVFHAQRVTQTVVVHQLKGRIYPSIHHDLAPFFSRAFLHD